MHYLIDGHNLIARMNTISLSDPDDEVQLILRLRSWTAVSRKRQVTVFFDGGIPGGKNVQLSTPQVHVIWSSEGRIADTLIIRAIAKLKNPPEYTLVTSDQQIIAAANGRKLPHIRSDQFAAELEQKPGKSAPPPTNADPQLSASEVDEWLNLFGPVDEEALAQRRPPTPPTRRPTATRSAEPEPEPEPAAPILPASANREEPELSNQELDEWLALFGGEPTPKTTPTPAKKGASSIRKRPSTPIPNSQNIDDDDLAAWQDFVDRGT
jgi:predicted RNA-binding protein with PIN domain